MGSIQPLTRSSKLVLLSSDDGMSWIQPNHSQTLAIAAMRNNKGKLLKSVQQPPKGTGEGTLYMVKEDEFCYVYWESNGLFPEYFICSYTSFLTSSPLWREMIHVVSPATETINSLRTNMYKRV